MADADELLKKKIAVLEEQLRMKDQELGRYRGELVRANQALEKVIADLDNDLRFAHLIQKVLCPTELPHISGVEFSSKFVPGVEFGGDYFDIFEHDDRLKFGMILSCSSGYTMSALLLSVLIKLSSQIEARRGLSPEQVLVSMAKEVIPQVQPKDRSHVFYGVVDRRSFELKYSMMGDLAAFLQVTGQENITRLEPSAGPIRAEMTDQPLAHTLQLGPRDRVILCTEGVVRAANADGELFGMDRLQEAIAKAPRHGVHELRNEVLFQVEQFTGQREFPRDQTILILEVKEKVIKLAK